MRGDLRTVVTTPEVPTLLTTSLVGRLPTAMAALAVLLLVRGQGGSYTLAGGLAALFTAGTAVGQPTLARVVDRRGQRTVLLASAGLSTLAFAVLAGGGASHAVVAAVAAAVAGLATPPLEPCLRALWPQLLPDARVLRSAFSLDVGLQEIVFVVGPLLTVAGVSVLGDRGGVLACALFGLLGSAAFALTRTSTAWRPTSSTTSGPHGSPLRHGVLVRAFLVALAGGVPVGALAIVAAAFAFRHGSTAITGWALAANAAGALASGVYGAVRPLGDTGARALLTAGLALALGYLPLALPLPVAGWIVAAVISGVALPVLLGLVFQRIQARCPPHLLTEANAWVVTAFGGGASVAALLAGIVTDRLAAATAIPTVVLACATFTATVCLLGYRRDAPASAA
jgi:MFS transporter